MVCGIGFLIAVNVWIYNELQQMRQPLSPTPLRQRSIINESKGSEDRDTRETSSAEKQKSGKSLHFDFDDDPSVDPLPPCLDSHDFLTALSLQQHYLEKPLEKMPNDITKEYTDVEAPEDCGVRMPHANRGAEPSKGKHKWEACDPTDTDFTTERDTECQEYLADWNNLRSLKVMSSHLYNGRTIKFKAFYHHGNVTAIVKVSQKKFVFEAISEYLAFTADRTLGLQRVPPTAYFPLPLDYLRAAVGPLGIFMSQWLENFIPNYAFTQRNLLEHAGQQCTMVAAVLWITDLHSVPETAFALDVELQPTNHMMATDEWLRNNFDPRHAKPLAHGRHREIALGEVSTRFVFDYIIGNTDRGLNDHNNFIYGGCSQEHHHRSRRCDTPSEPWQKLRTRPKFAYIDHGSSLHHVTEPETSPFSAVSNIICRFQTSAITALRQFKSDEQELHPFPDTVFKKLDSRWYYFIGRKEFDQMQVRIDKIISIVDSCLQRHSEADVMNLPEYNSDSLESNFSVSPVVGTAGDRTIIPTAPGDMTASKKGDDDVMRQLRESEGNASTPTTVDDTQAHEGNDEKLTMTKQAGEVQ